MMPGKMYTARRQRPARRFLVGALRRHDCIDCTPESCLHGKLCCILPALPALPARTTVLVLGEQVQGLGAKPATDLDANNDKAAESGSGKLWVTFDAVFGGSSKGAAGIDIGAGAGVAKPRQGRHDSSINCELGTAP